jgi:hypothetical protein
LLVAEVVVVFPAELDAVEEFGDSAFEGGVNTLGEAVGV